MTHRTITSATRDERGRVSRLHGDGWVAHRDDVLRDIEFAWNSYGVLVDGSTQQVGIVFGITGRYLEAGGMPLDLIELPDPESSPAPPLTSPS